MDAKTIFAAIALAIFANGIVLAIIYRDLPPRLRPAALNWQIGTVLIALGCAGFALEVGIYRPLHLTIVNGLLISGPTFYLRALQHFYGMPTRRWQLLPAALTPGFIFWFSAIYPFFGVRVAAFSFSLIFILFLCVLILNRNAGNDKSSSRTILVIIFYIVIFYAFIRFLFYAGTYFHGEFTVENGSSWMNLLSPIVMTLLPITGTTAFVLMCADYLRQKFEQAASTDYLTGLPNRRALVENGLKMMPRARAMNRDFALAILDVDNFKAINDTYGHDIGDQALVHIADRLREKVRPEDLIARSGGEEFVLLMEGLDHAATLEKVRALLLHIQRSRCETEVDSITLTLSAGIAIYHPADGSFNNLLRRADIALYDAKSGGRNRAEISTGW